MIEIQRQEYPRVEIFDPENNSIGICENEWEFVNVLLQIFREQAEGYTYSIVNESNEIISETKSISKTGRIKGSPYTKLDTYLREMMGF